MKAHYPTLMIFGSFDGLHPGHQSFIAQAEAYTDNLLIVLAQDEYITKTKERAPQYSLPERIATLESAYKNHQIIPGDSTSEEWSVLMKHTPHAIMLGYDQDALEKALRKVQEQFHFDIIHGNPFHPDEYKSSLLRDDHKD